MSTIPPITPRISLRQLSPIPWPHVLARLFTVGVAIACLLPSQVRADDEAALLLRVKKLEQTVESLQASNKANEAAQQRLQDIDAIQNLMSEERYLYEAGQFEDRWKLVAQHTPGTTVEIGARGVFRGQNARKTMVDYQNDGVRRHGEEMRKVYPETTFVNDHAGLIESSLLGTSSINIADDGSTAKGEWIALMVSAGTFTGQGAPKGHWVWWKIHADFVKEDGKWKFWHFQMNPVFTVFSEPNWAAQMLSLPPGPAQNHQNVGTPWSIPDGPTTAQYAPYRRTTVPER